jgi:hypothetical protein
MSFFPRIVGPVAPFSNLPIQPQNFQPSNFVITGVTFGPTTKFTLANGINGVAPNYVVGQQVKILMPQQYGAFQLNQQFGYVLSLPTSNTIVVGINSVGTDPFITSPTFLFGQSQTQPQIIAMGDISFGQINSSGTLNLGTYIPGSFQNIST